MTEKREASGAEMDAISKFIADVGADKPDPIFGDVEDPLERAILIRSEFQMTLGDAVRELLDSVVEAALSARTDDPLERGIGICMARGMPLGDAVREVVELTTPKMADASGIPSGGMPPLATYADPFGDPGVCANRPRLAR